MRRLIDSYFVKFIKQKTLFHLLKCENCCYFLFHKNDKINIFWIWSIRWKKQAIYRCHLGLWETVTDRFEYFRTLFGLNDESFNRKKLPDQFPMNMFISCKLFQVPHFLVLLNQLFQRQKQDFRGEKWHYNSMAFSQLRQIKIVPCRFKVKI